VQDIMQAEALRIEGQRLTVGNNQTAADA